MSYLMQKPFQNWLQRTTRSPLKDFTKFDDSFDQLLQDVFGGNHLAESSLSRFSPTVEVTEDNESYLLKFDLPGVSKEEIQIEAHNDQLTVKAERKEEKSTTERKKHIMEVAYGTYSRTFTLPTAINESSIEAKFENGVLKVKVPKTETPEVKKIQIQ